MISEREVEDIARVVTSNLIITLMSDLPGFKDLVDRASRRKGYEWSSEVDRFQESVREILEARLDDFIEH